MQVPATDHGKKLFFLKTDLPALLAFVLFAGLIFIYLLPGFEDAMMERKRILIKEMTSSAYSLLEHYHSLEIKGVLKSEEAMNQAKDAIGTIRYGEQLKDYFWITDREPVMVIHPYRPDLNGKDLSDFRDSKGKLIFVEFAKAVSLSGESYVEYMWQWNDDSTTIVPKLSYVRLFEPWHWIIGTGIYIEDVRTEIRRMEFRALIISGIIGSLIMILLSVITRQTHRIEQKRRKTEEDLFRSRDLYRTLAEAATEGVIVWTNHDIQANKILLTWLGYSEEEFKEKSFEEIFYSGDLETESGADTAYNKLGITRFGECNLKCSDGSILNAHSGYSRILLGEHKAVVIVIRPVKQHPSVRAFNLPPIILNSVSTGFFRISFGRKTRFLDATDPALQIFGIDNIEELLEIPVESIFIDPVQFRLVKKRLASKGAVSDMVLSLANKSGIRFEALVNAVVVEQNYPEILCEGTVEYLAVSNTMETGIMPVPSLYYFSMVQNAPVKTVMVTPFKCRYDTPAGKALEDMIAKDLQIIVVINKNGTISGTVELSEILAKLGNGEPANTKIGKWIKSPPDFIGIDKPLAFAIEIMYNRFKKALVVITTEGQLAGIITEREILKTLTLSDKLIRDLTEKASSGADLKQLYLRMREMAISMILGNTDPLTVASFISGTADMICSKAIEMCIVIVGTPPCKFAYIQTGSAGRMEQTLVTDQDNGIIFEDCDGERLFQAQKYFPLLGRKINEMLAVAGYNRCKGNNMAGNPKWCQSLSIWKEYFSGWIRVPEPNSLLDISIFFDFRQCYGDSKLTEELREFVNHNLVTNDIYFHHLVSALKQFKPSAVREESGITDIKRILMPFTGLIRLYTLKYGINEYSTNARILALHSGNHFNTRMLRDSLKSLKYLTSIRFYHQAECINGNREPDNLIDLSLADENSLYFVNLAIDNINNLMLKAENDFYVTEI